MECSTACEKRAVPDEEPRVPRVAEAVTESVTMRHRADARRSCHSRQTLRVNEPALDALTEATSWHGKRLALPVAERALLGVFLLHAGQILSREWLAATLGLSAEALDCHVEALRQVLRSAGSTCLPYTVRGLGYILWRG